MDGNGNVWRFDRLEISRTIVLRMDVPKGISTVLDDLSIRQSKWMNQVIRELYNDKRNHGWAGYGPDTDFGGKYGSIVRKNNKDETRWKIDSRAMYPPFIRDSTMKTYGLSVADRQANLGKLSTSWQNFLNGPKDKINRPRSKKGRTSLPTFKPAVRFRNQRVKINVEHGMVKSLLFKISGEKYEIDVISSSKESYDEYIKPLLDFISSGRTPGMEFHRKRGWWFVHIPIEMAAPKTTQNPGIIMGIDIGVKNMMAYAIIGNENGTPLHEDIISGKALLSNLERIRTRLSELRGIEDRGDADVSRAIRRLKGRQGRLQETIMREKFSRLIRFASENGVDGVVMEDLTSMSFRNSGMSRKVNRWISSWMRGRTVSFVKSKCEEHGLRFKDVDPRYTSRKCPNCGSKDKRSRNRRESTYKCVDCGYENNDDVVGAINIARRGWRYWHPKKKKSKSSPEADKGIDHVSTDVEGHRGFSGVSAPKPVKEEYMSVVSPRDNNDPGQMDPFTTVDATPLLGVEDRTLLHPENVSRVRECERLGEVNHTMEILERGSGRTLMRRDEIDQRAIGRAYRGTSRKHTMESI